MLIRSSLLASSALGATWGIALDADGEGEGGGGSSVQHLSGGVTRVAPDGDPEGQARREAEAAGVKSPELTEGQAEAPKLPEGYDSWETYGQDVAAGKVKPPVADAEEGAEAADDKGEMPPELVAKMAPYTEEFAKDGTLSDESVTKAAEEFGVSEEMVRQYLAGGAASAAASLAPFHEQTGGEEGYEQFVAWSVEGMTEAQQKELNKAYAGDNSAAALALQQKYVDLWKEAGNGSGPTDLTREAKNELGAPTTGYRSMAEQKADQADPRYAKDPAFRKDVEARIAATTAY